MESETETYCVTAEGTVVPIEVTAYLSSKDLTEAGVTWDRPLLKRGTTESSIYFVVDLERNAARVGFIVHRENVKDPGPDMFLNLEQDGSQIWVVSGDDRVYTVDVPE